MSQTPFVALLLITALALLVPVLASRFRRIKLPIVVGEIIAGMAIGHSGLDLVTPSATLEFLAEFGFAFLMFLSGLEVDFSLLRATSTPDRTRRGWWSRRLPMAFWILALTIGLALLGSLGLKMLGLAENPLLLALILSTTSLGVVLPVLKEKQIIDSRFGQFLLVASSVADFVTLMLLTVVIAASSQGFSVDLLLVLVLVAVFALLARVGPRFASLPMLRKLVDELSHATAQIRVRGAFALMVGWVVLAQALGVELILGAFLAGAAVGLLESGEESPLREKLDAIGFGFFIPIFFINVGINFRLHALLESRHALLLLPVLVALAYLVKVVPALLLRFRFGWRETLAGGFLLSSRLSLIIAASAIALDIKAISEAVNAAVVLVAVITCTVSPVLFNRLCPRRSRDRRAGVIIAGANQMSELLARRLGSDVVFVSEDQLTCDDLRQQVMVVEGRPNEETLARAGAEKAAALVTLCADPALSTEICKLARDRFDIPLVVASMEDIDRVSELKDLGVKVVQPTMAMAVAIEGALRFPTAFDVLVDHEDGVEVGDAVLHNEAFADRPLRSLQLPGNALVLSVRREGSVMVPHGDSIVREGDHLALIGSPDSLERAIALLGRGAADEDEDDDDDCRR